MKLLIDLCSGLGGFSRAFEPSHWVVKIDIQKKFKPTIQADVRHLPLKRNLEPDVLLASPPCERFSIATGKWPKMGLKLAMELVGACFESVAYLNPKFWLIENPMGRLRWFVGEPKQTIRYGDYDLTYPAYKPTDLWGNIVIPFAEFRRAIKDYGSLDSKGHVKSYFKYGPRSPSKRAEIPLGVSLAVRDGVKNASL